MRQTAVEKGLCLVYVVVTLTEFSVDPWNSADLSKTIENVISIYNI